MTIKIDSFSIINELKTGSILINDQTREKYCVDSFGVGYLILVRVGADTAPHIVYFDNLVKDKWVWDKREFAFNPKII